MRLILVLALGLCMATLRAMSPDSLLSVINQRLYDYGVLRDSAQLAVISDSLTKHFDTLFAVIPDRARIHGRIKGAGVVVSDDRKVALVTWRNSTTSESSVFNGLVYYSPAGDSSQRYRLLHKGSLKSLSPSVSLRDTAWYGCLYYDIVTAPSRDGDYYVLLGFNAGDFFSNFKLIDILWFGMNGAPILGKPVLMDNGRAKCRAVFEYAEEAVMSLRYIPESKQIVFDHLSPLRPSLEGNYQFYGPDFSYDAYRFDKGIWYLQADIDVRTK